MNAISSGVNKGAVKVAPKAGAARRLRANPDVAPSTRLAATDDGLVAQPPTLSGVGSHTARAHGVPVRRTSTNPESKDEFGGSSMDKEPGPRRDTVLATIAHEPHVVLESNRNAEIETSTDHTQPRNNLRTSEESLVSGNKHKRTFKDARGDRPPGLAVSDSDSRPQLSHIESADTSAIFEPDQPNQHVDSAQLSGETQRANTESTATFPGSPQLTNVSVNNEVDTSPVSDINLENQSYTKYSRKGSSTQRRKREQTPEDAELERIDVSDVRMLDLCKDLRKGRKSAKYEQFKLMKAANKRKKRNDGDETAGTSTNIKNQLPEPGTDLTPTVRSDTERANEVGSDSDDPGRDIGASDNEDNETQSSYLPNLTSGAPQVRIVDGKIVLDVGSLQVDRSLRDAAGLDASLEYVEENPLEKMVNSRTHSKHKLTARWDALSTELFYSGLSQWGTDFEMISRMFPTRNRKQIKSKFTTEERRNPGLVNKALVKRQPIDMAEYSRVAEMQFKSVSELEAELAELKAQFESEREEAIREAQSRKVEVHDTALVPLPGEVSKFKKSRRRAADDGLEVVGDIDEVEAQEREALARAAMSSDDENP